MKRFVFLIFVLLSSYVIILNILSIVNLHFFIFLLLFYLWIVLWLPTVLHRTKNGTAIPNPFSEQILMYVPLLCASLLE